MLNMCIDTQQHECRALPCILKAPVMDRDSFNCSRCGSCCRAVDLHHWYSNLDRGDGVCKNLNELSSECSIYETRPDLCRVVEQYSALFSVSMTINEYITQTKSACKFLQERLALNHPCLEL